MKKGLPAYPLIIRVLKAPFARWHRKYLGQISHPSCLANLSHGAIFPCNSHRQAGEEQGEPFRPWGEHGQRHLASMQLVCEADSFAAKGVSIHTTSCFLLLLFNKEMEVLYLVMK